MSELPDYLQRLAIGPDADERAIKRAYARELKLIDQETDAAGFQQLRESYESALFFLRHAAAMEQEADGAAQAAQQDEGIGHARHQQTDVPQPEPGEEELARQVFDEFRQRCAALADIETSEAWERELYASLADTRLIHVGARALFEEQVACLLANGWRPGHHVLLFAAVRVFEWARDRRRVRALGMAGYTLDIAIEQRAVYDAQPAEDCELQRQLIVRLRDPRLPSARELLSRGPLLAEVAERFPTWLALVTDVGNIARWNDLEREVAPWRRALHRLKDWKRLPFDYFWWGVVVLVVIGFLSGIMPGQRASTMRPSAEVALAQGYADDGDFDEALIRFDRAIRRDPGNIPAYAGRALALLSIDDKQGAVRDLDKLESLDKFHPALFRGRGRLAYKERRFEDAVTAFTREIERDSTSTEARLWRAFAYEALRQEALARADADTVLQKEPGNIDARLVRARIFKRAGDKPAELAEASALLAANTRNGEAYIAAARMYIDVRERGRALAIVNRGVDQLPSLRILLFRALIRDANDFAGRRSDIKAALALHPGAAEGLLMRVRLELEAGQYDAVLEAVEIAIQAESTRGSRHYLLASRGIAFAKQGKFAEAETEFGTAKASAKNATDLNNLCWALARQNVALETALSFCDEALRRAPENRYAQDSKGYVLLRLGRNKAAIAAYDKVLKEGSASPESQYGRGVGRRRMGDRQGGDADIEAALARDPEVAATFQDLAAGGK